jgi:hypothetical protein
VTIALVFKLVTWILRHRGLAITVCKAGLRGLWLRIKLYGHKDKRVIIRNGTRYNLDVQRENKTQVG